MLSVIFSFNLCLFFQFGLQICPEEVTTTGLSVKWERSLPANNVVSKPLCYVNDRLVKRNCVDTEWDPPASALDPCAQVLKYYNVSSCPPGFEKISKQNRDYCYQIKEASPWDYPCIKSGGASVITHLSDDDLKSLLSSLIAKNISRYFWLPAKRAKFLSPVQWFIPGPKWAHPVDSNNSLRIDASILKTCLLLDIEEEVLITESCTEIHHSLCFYINDIHYPAKCPENYHSVRYMPDEGICLGIEYSSTNLTFDEFIDKKICNAPMGGRDSNDLSRFIFKKIAKIHNLPSDEWCWFAATNWNNGQTLEETTENILSFLFPDKYVSINNIGTISLINPDLLATLPCMACQTEVIYEKTELIFEYNDERKLMYLTIYFPSGLWKYDQHDRGIQCFSDAKGFVKVIDINDIPFIEIESFNSYDMINDTLDIDKIVYAINLITDRAAQYWCEGHTKDFSLIKTDKIVVNPQGDEVHVFSLVIKIHVSDVNNEYMLDTLRSNLCSNITHIFGANKVVLMEYLDYNLDHILMVVLHMDITIDNIYYDKARNLQSTFNKLKAIADTELPKYNYTLVNISSSMYCLPTTSDDSSHTLNWDLTSIGHITAPKQFCLQENGLPVRRLCDGSFLLGSYWGRVFGTCNKNYQPSDTTTFLYNFVRGQVPENDTSRFLTDGLSFVLGDVNIIIPADIYYLSMSLQHILQIAQENKTSVDMGSIHNIAWAMDRLMVLNNNYLRLAQTLNSTNVILDSINNIIEMLTKKNGNITESFRSERNSMLTNYQLAVQPQFILQISYPWLTNISGVAVLKNSEDNKFTDMQIKPLYTNTTLKEILLFKNLEIATWIPEQLLNTLKVSRNESNNETEINKDDVHIIISVFHNDAIFQEIENSSYSVNSRIIGVSIPGFLSNLEKPMPLIYKDLVPAVENRLCGYWDFQSNSGSNVPGYWSNSGCYLRKSENYLTFCECYHLTNFGQLLDIKRGQNNNETEEMKKHNKPLNIISLVGSFLSLLGIVGIWITATVFHTWRKKAGTKVLLHLSASIALPLLFLIVFNLDNTIFDQQHDVSKISDWSKTVCIILGSLLHYSVLASFMWMLITAVLQFIRYVRVLGVYRPSRFMIKFTLIGWGIPIIPVIVVLVLDKENYLPAVAAREFKYSICYPSGFYLIVTVIVPICIILLINVTLFILVLCAISKGPDGKMRTTDLDLIGAQLRLSIFLFFLLGLTWIFGIISFSDNIIWSYLFCLTSTMQGFVLFIYFVVCDAQTRNLWVSLMKPQFRPGSSRESITSLSSN